MGPPSYPGPECSRFPVRMSLSRITELRKRRGELKHAAKNAESRQEGERIGERGKRGDQRAETGERRGARFSRIIDLQILTALPCATGRGMGEEGPIRRLAR